MWLMTDATPNNVGEPPMSWKSYMFSFKIIYLLNGLFVEGYIETNTDLQVPEEESEYETDTETHKPGNE